MEEFPWTEEEEDLAEHPYYNNIPGKMPPPGGFIDSRLPGQGGAPNGGQVLPALLVLFFFNLLVASVLQTNVHFL